MSGVWNCGELVFKSISLLTSQQYPLIINNLQQKCHNYALQMCYSTLPFLQLFNSQILTHNFRSIEALLYFNYYGETTDGTCI